MVLSTMFVIPRERKKENKIHQIHQIKSLRKLSQESSCRRPTIERPTRPTSQQKGESPMSNAKLCSFWYFMSKLKYAGYDKIGNAFLMH